jgi:hypothetical protein
MQTTKILRDCGAILAGGGIACAVAIALEALTDPDDADQAPHYVAALAAPVALLLFFGVLAVIVGLASLAAHVQAARGRGTLWIAAIGVGLAIAEIPHTILDMTAIPAVFKQLPHSQAHDLVDNHFESLPGALSGIGILPLLIGSIMLARLLWNGSVLPRWAPRSAIACLIIAIAMLPASSLSWWFPHGPVLLYIGIAAYGAGLIRAAADAHHAPSSHSRSEVGA